MKGTLRYRYVKFPKIKLKLKQTPIGRIALTYNRPFIFVFFRPSRNVVVRAMICVAMVAKIICHAVRVTGYSGKNTSVKGRFGLQRESH
jgi:hypothetical protein